MPSRTVKSARTGKTKSKTKNKTGSKTASLAKKSRDRKAARARTKKAEAAAKGPRTDTRPRASTSDPAYTKAPGKRHRQPPPRGFDPNAPGTKKSDTTIAKSMVFALHRRMPHS
jgi:hypothetical protein